MRDLKQGFRTLTTTRSAARPPAPLPTKAAWAFPAVAHSGQAGRGHHHAPDRPALPSLTRDVLGTFAGQVSGWRKAGNTMKYQQPVDANIKDL